MPLTLTKHMLCVFHIFLRFINIILSYSFKRNSFCLEVRFYVILYSWVLVLSLQHAIASFQKPTEFGDIMFSLSYLPTAERLTIVIVKARNLKWTENKDAGGIIYTYTLLILLAIVCEYSKEYYIWAYIVRQKTYLRLRFVIVALPGLFSYPFFGHVRPAKHHINLRICGVWYECSLGAF